MENRLKFEDNQDYDALKKYDSRINDLSSFINKTKNKLSYKLPKEERKDLEKILENQQNRLLGFISEISQSSDSINKKNSNSNSDSDS